MYTRHFSTNSLKREKPTPIRTGGKVIGEVRGDTFFKKIRGSIHFLREPRAICFSIDSLEAAVRAGARQAKILDSETGIVYVASIERIRQIGFVFNRNYGNQIGLPLSDWKEIKPDRPIQPGLFENR